MHRRGVDVESLSTKETGDVIRRTRRAGDALPATWKYIHDRVGVIEECGVRCAEWIATDLTYARFVLVGNIVGRKHDLITFPP